MNLVDPELEFIDPTPNVHSLFVHFDMTFFWTTLLGRATVRWSKRMYSSAGTCSYEGRGGLVDIALSEPLLKLRPRKDLVETLLHEMIHAYLFVVGRDQWRDGHGPNFLAHMHRINKAAGVNITVYHDFHDEVKLYQNHVWRCNGPCQKMRPNFGIIRRSMNRAPGPSDYWWNKHKRYCGGSFIKCNEPVEMVKKPTKIAKTPYADITKYINNNDNTMVNKNVNPKPVLVFTGSGPVGGNKSSVSVVETVRNVWASNKIPGPIAPLTKKDPKVSASQVNANKRLSNVDHSNSLTTPKKIDDYYKTTASSIAKEPQHITKLINNNTLNNKNAISKPVLKPTVSTGSDPAGERSSLSVVENVRNVWANNTLPSSAAPLTKKDPKVSTSQVNANKRLSTMDHSDSLTPPKKLTKIDDYFKTTASSILRDVYGKDFTVAQSTDTNKLKAVAAKETLVKCPVCNAQVSDIQINRHLDECLNYNVVEKLSKETIQIIEPSSGQASKNEIKNKTETVEAISFMPASKSSNTYDKVKQETPDHPNSITNRHTSIKIKAEKHISTNAEPSRSNGLDLRTGFAQVKAEPSKSNCIDLRTGSAQVKAEPSKSNCIDLRTGSAQVKAEPNKSNCVDLTKGFVQIKAEPNKINCVDLTTGFVQVKAEPSSSKITENHICPCCGKVIYKPVQEHLDECQTFVDNTTNSEEGASTSFGDKIIVIDDSCDEFDETLILNATGTKSPCPCCMTMVEIAEMNDHLDLCLLAK